MEGSDNRFTIAKKPFLLPRSFSYHQTFHRRSREASNVILYTTSLRGIRRTHEDCCAVRAILRGFRVAVDERDVSMDAAYRRKLQSLIAGKGRPASLPQLFVRGSHVGGAEEVRRSMRSAISGDCWKEFLVGTPRSYATDAAEFGLFRAGDAAGAGKCSRRKKSGCDGARTATRMDCSLSKPR